LSYDSERECKGNIFFIPVKRFLFLLDLSLDISFFQNGSAKVTPFFVLSSEKTFIFFTLEEDCRLFQNGSAKVMVVSLEASKT